MYKIVQFKVEVFINLQKLSNTSIQAVLCAFINNSVSFIKTNSFFFLYQDTVEIEKKSASKVHRYSAEIRDKKKKVERVVLVKTLCALKLV